MRERLVDAAKAHDYSLTQEIEQRLERSLNWEDASSLDTFDALDAIQTMMEAMNQRVGASWSEDLTAWEIVTDGIVELMLAYKPERRNRFAPPIVDLNAAQSDALDEYEAALDAWETKRTATGRKQLRVLMMADAGSEITEADRVGVALKREEGAALGCVPN